MSESKNPLYQKAQADFMRQREKAWDAKEKAKYQIILDNLDTCSRLVDIGCGWGQFLRIAADRVPEVWGVDESPERLTDIEKTCPSAKIKICSADRLSLPDNYFDAAVTSQMMHEAKLFGSEDELIRILQEIRRVLKSGAKYLLVDHLDSGPGEVEISLPDEALELLEQFKQHYRYGKVAYQAAPPGNLIIPKRTLQDFLTKIWSFDSPMQEIEMNETHNVFGRRETEALLTENGFAVERWIEFADIEDDLKKVGGKLVRGETWFRKFLCRAVKN